MSQHTSNGVVALIPARGGSRTLPRKNVRQLAGKPLIAWTIEAARSARCIDEVWVSTDDPEIRLASLAAGARVLDRPAALARDSTPTAPVVSHFLGENSSCRSVVLLQPTSPLRRAADIEAAYCRFVESRADLVVSVTPAAPSLLKAFVKGPEDQLQAAYSRRAPFSPRQSLPTPYYADGAIYIFGAARFLEEGGFPSGRIVAYEMPEERSIDIDDATDFAKAERLMTKHRSIPAASFSIAGRAIGEDHPPLVVAEIGINHNGSLELAKTLVDSAIRAGAEVVKHQTHVIEDEMTEEARSVIPGNASESIYDIMSRCALGEEDEWELMRHTQEQGAIFISTPFSRAAADRLQRMEVPAFKIGSGECNNYPLLEHVASMGRPVIVSTGMNTLKSVSRAVDILRRHHTPFALLHCTNVYPTPDHLVRLGGIAELRDAFPDAVVGLSDHTIGNSACLAAVALGASIVERHYTDTRQRPGPDIACSMDEAECAALITESRRIFLMRGGRKGMLPEESSTAAFAFASVTTSQPIRAGEAFTRENLWVRRPGTGHFPAERYDSLLGRTAARDLPEGVQLQQPDVAEPTQ